MSLLGIRFANRTQQIVANVKAHAASGGLTLADVGRGFYDAIDTLVAEAQTVQAPGPVKKIAVVDGLDTVFATLVAYIPLPWYLSWAKPFIIPAIHMLITKMSHGAIESAVAKLPAVAPVVALEGSPPPPPSPTPVPDVQVAPPAA